MEEPPSHPSVPYVPLTASETDRDEVQSTTSWEIRYDDVLNAARNLDDLEKNRTAPFQQAPAAAGDQHEAKILQPILRDVLRASWKLLVVALGIVVLLCVATSLQVRWQMSMHAWHRSLMMRVTWDTYIDIIFFS